MKNKNRLRIGLKVNIPAPLSTKILKGKVIKMSDNGDKERFLVRLDKKHRLGFTIVSVPKSDFLCI